MTNETGTITPNVIKGATITTCFLTILLPFSAVAADPKLIEANNNLQAIFKRIHKKYDAYDAQQAELVAQAQAQSSSNASQHFDVSANDVASSGFSDTSNSTQQTAYSLPPSPTVGSRFAAGEELILSTSVNTLELASIFAVKSEQGVQVGLSDFFQIIEFPIYVDLDKVNAEGWFLNESNRFSLVQLSDGRLEINVNQKTFYVDAKKYSLDGDLFVELDDVADWFMLEYELNEERLALALNSQHKFPVEMRLARLDKHSIVAGTNATSVLPLKDSGYKAFSAPMLDIQTSAQHSKWVIPPNASSTEEQTFTQTSANYSILANHDLAFLNAELFLAGNKDDALNSAWLTMSRQSDAADLLGPLNATQYAFGDVTPVNAGFGRTQGISRGFSFANTPINQLADNRKVNITGEIQVGWDIELYRNGVLVDQRFGISGGRYEFNDTPLDFGNNDFELIFYGPQGQIETKHESYLVDSNTVSAGEGMYRFSLVQVGESVFNMDPFFDDPTLQGTMASSVVDYGLTDWLALTTGASVFEPKEGETQHFVTVGANASFGRLGLLNANILQDEYDRRMMDASYRTRFLDTSYSLGFRRIEDPATVLADDVYSDQLSANMSGQLFTGTRVPINYQNSWQRTEKSDGSIDYETFQNSIGIGSRLGYFSNSLAWQEGLSENSALTSGLDPNVKNVTGAFQYRKNFGKLNARLFTNYIIEPVDEISAYGGVLNYNWTPDFNSEVRYTYYPLTDKYQANLGLNWRKDAFQLNTSAGYTEDGSWMAGIALRFSLGYEPIQQQLFTSGRPISQSGAVSVRVFEDLNMNGSFDDNERPIENATVKAVQAYRQEQTNESGVAVLSSLHNNIVTDIVVDESTLDGPFMITANRGVAIKARKGFVDRVDIPVVKAGELDGVIYLKDASGEALPAAYIMLNLLNNRQDVVASARSEFDGYYLFTNVKPGTYQLKVDENYVERRGLKSADKRVGFSSEGDVIAGVDFVLQSLDQAKGYVASAGHFDSANMLKLYYQILRNKSGGQFEQAPFFIKFPDGGGYTLGLAYFEGDEEMGVEAQRNAQKACTELAKKDIYCDVQYHDFKY